MEFGTKLKDARVNSLLKQEEVAQQLGVSRQSISNWENNRSLPDLRSIVQMSDLYEISLDELLKGDAKVMEKLIRDSDVKKANTKVEVLTVVLMAVTTIVILPILPQESRIIRLIELIVLCCLFVLLIKSIYDQSRLLHKKDNQQKVIGEKRMSTRHLMMILAGIIIVGLLGGFIVGYFF